MDAQMDLAAELQKIYDSEINIEISWLWDSGIDLRLGDCLNGYLAEENVQSMADIPGSRKLLCTSTQIPPTRKGWTQRFRRVPNAGSSGHPQRAHRSPVRIAERPTRITVAWKKSLPSFAFAAELPSKWNHRRFNRMF